MDRRTGSAQPASVVELDLGADPAQALDGLVHDRVWAVVRHRGVPQAVVETSRDGAAVDLAALVGLHLTAPLDEVPDAALPTASVVVPSLVARDEDLLRCLTRLEELDYPQFEIILVDNRPRVPTDDSLPTLLAAHPAVRSVRAAFPGASAARNAGAAAATGEIVAFTDDDVRVSPTWLKALGRRFVAEPRIDVVTGLILPAELETPAQVHFERYYGGFAGVRTFRRLTIRAGHGVIGRARMVARDDDGAVVRRSAVYGVGAFGASANLAVRRSVLIDSGGFDPALGAGTAAMGGEDLELLVTMLWRGRTLGYEPAAYVYHRHRDTDEGLRRQMHGYGLGYTATLAALVGRDPRHLVGIGSQAVPAVGRQIRLTAQRLRGRGAAGPARSQAVEFPPELARIETRAMPKGPGVYVRNSFRMRHRVAPAYLSDFVR